MGFEALLGNEQLKYNLHHSLQHGHISHFYLICGPEGSGRHTLAKLLAAAIVCQGQQKPCLSCHPCRKVREGNHPDFITVEDPEHKTVPVRVVRQFREDVFIRPNEAEYKIYLFPQELGVEGQNALLKILEEPPPYGVFIMLTDNPEQILPTVRSRCTQLTLRPLDEKTLLAALAQEFPKVSREDLIAAAGRSGGFFGQAKRLLAEGISLPQQAVDFAHAFATRDALLLTTVLISMEKWKRDPLLAMLQQWMQLTESGLAYRSGLSAISEEARAMGTQRSPQELMHAIDALKTAIEYTCSNVSTAAICGWLSWQLR